MILIDTNNLLWRAFHVSKDLSSKGRPTGVLHVGLTMIASIRDVFEKQNLLFLWDSGPYNRKIKILPEYKGNRDKDSEDRKKMAVQMPIIKQVLRDLGIAQAEYSGHEADDLAGYFSAALSRKNLKTTLVSGDKDWFQLLRPGVIQVRKWTSNKKDMEIWTHERVQKEMGISVEKWPDFLALIGDKVDNIPKALGFRRGEKVAKRILSGQKGIFLTPEEKKQFDINIQITTIHTTPFDPVYLRSMVKKYPRTDAGYDRFSRVLEVYELWDLYGERKKLWELGTW